MRGRRQDPPAPTGGIRAASLALALAAALVVTLALAGPASARAASCSGGELAVAGGCASRAEARAEVERIVRRQMRELGLKATILRVDTGARPLLSKGFGSSMSGVPARPDMHFRIGSMAIPHLVTLLLLLQDEGKLSLDDKLAEYRPGLPNAKRITLRMLTNNTSGYRDWIQGNQAFVDALLSAPFKQWTVAELLATAFARGPACEPGSCFHYAHTNYAVLAQVIAKATGRSVGDLIHERILAPLGLRQTAISRQPAMPGPVLHSYTAERGVYEDATFWSPSWTIGAGTVMSATIGDVARSARAIGTGALLSRRANRERFAPVTVSLPQFSRSLYFAQGIVVANGWRLQNPMLNGYTGVMAYLPARRLSIAIVATTRPRAARDERAFASVLFSSLAAYLSPGRQPSLPG